MISRLTNAFPIWTVSAGILALIWPDLFTWFSGLWITVGLGLIMLGMGITLNVSDFSGITKHPKWVLTGLLLQFTVMPLLGFGVANLLQLPIPFAVGLILVSCCPGGTASNVITYLAKCNLALSVTMTLFSTAASVICTPLLTGWLASSRLEVNVMGLFWSACQVVVLPIAIGILLNFRFPRFSSHIASVSPLTAVVLIALIVGSIIGSKKDAILHSGGPLILGVLMVHLGGFLLGFLFSRAITRDRIVARTISIEVGMQNSGLGVVLAKNNFSDPLTAVPSAISSLTHCVIGSIVATAWRRGSQVLK